MSTQRAASAATLTDLLFEKADVGLCLVAPDGTVLRANPEWLRSTGFSLDQVLGADIIELFPAARDLSRALHARARAGHHVNVSRHVQLVGGQEAWWEGSIDPVPMEGGNGLLITAWRVPPPSSEDMSDAALVFETMLQGVVFQDAAGKIIAMNPAAERILGKTRAEFLGETSASVQHDTIREDGSPFPGEEHPAMVALRTAREVRDVVMGVFNPREGERRWIRITAVPLLESAGSPSPSRVYTVFEDITERKRAQERLAADLAALTRMHALSGRAVESAGIDALLQETMDAAVALMSADKGTLQLLEGEALRIAAHRGHQAPFLEFFADAANRASVCGEATRRGERVLVPDVEKSPILAGTASLAVLRAAGVRAVQSTPLRTRAGRLLGVLTTHWSEPHTPGEHDLWRLDLLVRQASDFIEQKQAEEQRLTAVRALEAANAELREAEHRKDEFLAVLSHELRNPLAPIRNASYVLRNASPGSEEARRANEVIERQAKHLTRLVDDLLDVTRIARGKIELRRVRIDLREVVLRAADDHRLPLEDRGVAFRIELPDAKVWAEVDPTRITQIVGNLLHNAAKFTRRGDEVELKLDLADGEAEIRVRDTGAGIDPALLPRLFEPFVQGERTLARTEGGLGLGLSLVRAIAELHGGTARARSAGKGQGAEFVVRLPVIEPESTREGEPSARGPSSGGRRLLVVDDNADAADSLADLLRLQGHAVDVAYDGPSALAKIGENGPDVVLCDIGLPGMSGYEVARAVRAAGQRGIRLVALTGYGQPEDVQRAVEAGFDAHLAKPPDPDELARLLA